MQKEENSSAPAANLDYSPAAPNSVYRGRPLLSYEEIMKAAASSNNSSSIVVEQGGVMVDYMLNNPAADPINVIPVYEQQQLLLEPNSSMINTDDRTLSFADVMQFADFGPKLALNHPAPSCQQQEDQEASHSCDVNTINSSRSDGDPDPAGYFLKFPVLSNSFMIPGHDHDNNSTRNTNVNDNNNHREGGFSDALEEITRREFRYHNQHQEQDGSAAADGTNSGASNYNNPVQLEFLGNATVTSTHDGGDKIIGAANNVEGAVVVGNKSSSSSKRKRPRTVKTSEEVESQRMTHIAVERNRRKQMNEHLRVLRSLMPSSYVQRGDQASIIGGAIEFVRELEQLLQCLESQKRRLYGDQARQLMGDSSSSSSNTLGLVQQQQQPPMGFLQPMLPTAGMVPNPNPNHQQDDQVMTAATGGGGLLREETAESKSCIADVEVKVLGLDALIKILSRRRPGQLIKAIAALEDLHLAILHTNITTIEQTVLYSFNVKVASEARFTAEDIASSVQQIFTFIHANTNVI